MNRYAEQLAAAGMNPAEAESKGDLFERAAKVLPGDYNPAGLRTIYVPGRIEVLGKHTDYAGGHSLLCAVERGFCLAARARQDAQVLVWNARTRERCTLKLDPEFHPAEGGWSNYPGVAARRIAHNFPSARRGADLAFISDLPAASGMSSSSALIVAIFLALSDINALAESAAYRREIRNQEDLAGYLGTVENGESFGSLAGGRGVGTFGGSEDHTAILCSRAGELRQYSFCPIRLERTLVLPDDLVFCIGVSGIVAMKTGAARAAYNRASSAAKSILEIWRAETGRSDRSLAAAAASAPDAPRRILDLLHKSGNTAFSSDLLANRFEQFLLESAEIVPGAAEALASRDLHRFRLLVERSQQAAENLLGNQVPETIALVRSAHALGAIAASAFGAGFGGSVWAMLPASDAAGFESHWASMYRDQFPGAEKSCFFSTHPGPGAMRL